jgi:hypothetical protein
MEIKIKHWCINCKEFTLHSIKTTEDVYCDICDLKFESGINMKIPQQKAYTYALNMMDYKYNKNDEYIIVHDMNYVNSLDEGYKSLLSLFKTYDESLIPHKTNQIINGKKVRTGKNKSCPCGSGKKFKKCCLNK